MADQTTTARNGTEGLAGKYLTFALGNEVYGLEILKVREIIGLMNITVVPRTPTSIRGVINLRGKIIPVLDLRVKFDMPRIADTDQTCIIVVDTTVDDHTAQMGILVDTVSEVLDIIADNIEPTPDFGDGVEVDYIRGIAKIDTKVTILLDIDKVTDPSTIQAMSQAAATATAAAAQPKKEQPQTSAA